MKSKAAAMWDASATVYEQGFERSTTLWGLDALVLGQLPSTVDSSPRFLDVACGPGALAIAAAAKGFDVTATDFSPGMLALLDAKLAASGHKNLKIATRVVDGETLDSLEDASFDVVSSIFGIMLFADRAAAWQAAWRVLKPGGRLLAASWDINSANMSIVRYFLQHAANKPDAVAPNLPPLGGNTNRTLVPATFREELEEFGFRNVRIHSVKHSMCFHSGQEIVEGMLGQGVFRFLSTHKDEASVRRCILDCVQHLIDGVDPFGDEAQASALANAGKTAENHPLWDQPFAMPALGHIAVATK